MPKRAGGNDDPRGSKKGKGGLTQKYNQHYAAAHEGDADWGTCDGEVLGVLIAGVCETGAAILFGYSRDRGAYRIIVMDDDGKITKWIPCTAEITEALWAFLSDLKGDANDTE